MTMNFSLRISLISALMFASLALPGAVAADSTVCYPDGCATFNFAITKADYDSASGNSATLAQAFEVMT